MKNILNVEQCKELAKFIPMDKADMVWVSIYDENHLMSDYRIELIPYRFYSGIGVPCWSLSSLFDYLMEIDFFPEIITDRDPGTVYMYADYFDESEGKLVHPVKTINVNAKTFIDCCYAYIMKLKETNCI